MTNKKRERRQQSVEFDSVTWANLDAEAARMTEEMGFTVRVRDVIRRAVNIYFEAQQPESEQA